MSFLSTLKPKNEPVVNSDWERISALKSDSSLFDFTHRNSISLMKQSLISKKRWQPTLDSAKQSRDVGDFERCYHYLRELLHSLDNQNRTGINLNDEQTNIRDEAKRIYSSIILKIKEIDSNKLNETFGANKKLIEDFNFVDWSAAIKQSFYQIVYQSCTIENAIKILSFNDAVRLLDQGYLPFYLVNVVPEDDAKAIVGTAKGFAHVLRTYKTVVIDLDYAKVLNRLILYGEERSGSLRNPDMHAFEQGLLWLEENPLIDPIMRASLIHYLECYIHVFVDGNGRLSRLLMNAILMKYGFPPICIPDTEGRNNDHPDTYMGSLFNSASGDVRPFVNCINRHVNETIEKTLASNASPAAIENSMASERQTGSGHVSGTSHLAIDDVREHVEGHDQLDWGNLFNRYVNLDSILAMEGPFIRVLPSLKFSSNAYSIPQIGFGTWLIKDPQQCNASVKFALDAGYRHLDCAYVYGNQLVVGETIKDAITEGIVKREQLFITSKVWNTFHSHQMALKNVEMILDELKLDYLDLCLIHWPFGYAEETGDLFPKNQDGIAQMSDVDYLDTWRALEECVKNGKIRSIGLSNFNAQQVDRVIANCEIKPAALEVEMHPYFQQAELVKFCNDKGIVVIAYSPLGNPSKDNPFFKSELPTVFTDPVITDIAKAHQKSNAQVVLRFLTQRYGVCVIPKSVNDARIRENFATFEDSQFVLSDDELQQMEKLDLGPSGRRVRVADPSHKYYPFDAPPKLNS